MTYFNTGRYQILTLQLLYICQTGNGAKRKKENSPSKPKEMPKDYIPVHFLSWLTYGPASDNPNPLWITDTGKSIVKEKANILDMKVEGSNNGKMSSFSRKAQRLEATQGKAGNSKVLDLTTSDDVSNGLLKQSIKNSSMIVKFLERVTDDNGKNIAALVANASKMYDIRPNEQTLQALVEALEEQARFLRNGLLPQPIVKEEAMRREEIDGIQSNDDCRNLDVSLDHEILDSPYNADYSPDNDC